MKRFEFIEHTADVAIRAYGDNLEQAFAVAAEAMFAIITDSAPIARVRKWEFQVESIDRESLLIGFLSQLIVIHEVERTVLTDFAVSFTSPNRLRCVCWGEPFEESRHGQGIQVKGVSYHMLEIKDHEGNAPASVQVLFDI